MPTLRHAAAWLTLGGCGADLPDPAFREPLTACAAWPADLWQAPGYVLRRCEPDHLVLSGPPPLSATALWGPRLVANGWTEHHRLEGPTHLSIRYRREADELIFGGSIRDDGVWVGLTRRPAPPAPVP